MMMQLRIPTGSWRSIMNLPPAKRPLGHLLVAIESQGVTQCVADVTGIDDPQTLYGGMIATFREHNGVWNEKSGFLDCNCNRLVAHQLFDLCHRHGDLNSPLKIIEYQDISLIRSSGYVDIPDESEGLIPLEGVVVEVFSHHGQPICSVSLSGVAETRVFCDRVVAALQWKRFYLPGRTKILSSDGRNLAELKNRAFLQYFERHSGNLKLTVEAYQSLARRTSRITQIPPQSPTALELSADVFYINGRSPQASFRLPLGRTVFTLMSFRSKVCIVSLVDARDGQTIRCRVFDALKDFDYLVRPEVPIQISDSYDPEAKYVSYLTDQALFYLCRERSDIDGTLCLFVEIPIAVHATQRPKSVGRQSLPIPVEIFDWRDLTKCFDVQLKGCCLQEIQEAFGPNFKVVYTLMGNHSLTLEGLRNWAKQSSGRVLQLYVLFCPKPTLDDSESVVRTPGMSTRESSSSGFLKDIRSSIIRDPASLLEESKRWLAIVKKTTT